MRTFLATFRAIVIPDLRRQCVRLGLTVALGVDTWPEAYDRIHAHARARGALHLSLAEIDQLDDWITTNLLRAIDAQTYAVRRLQECGVWPTT